MKQQKTKLESRIASFKFAIQGLVVAFNGELNLRIHCIAALLVIGAAIYFDLPPIEWIALCFAIALVIISELINTALEYLSDVVSPQQNPQIKKVKDIAAGAVLFASLLAITVGLLIFLPKII
ncbi:diacylglycerol kinase family protein [Sphingobacterium deserti]|uniref:Diacylglycerol kinase n=1 Tax=Sphingobacterium deserti TaxID=1229276 RepID=A0A0B8TCT0_9SPHI|nr:diacylglycerol kinase family protein [Sphingobacterium deserti]KGE16170.1 diacylglycerol kinase [Sphingobacterium deserti]